MSGLFKFNSAQSKRSAQPKCKKHNEEVKFLCSNRECITLMKYAMCEYCFNDHEHDHIIITLSQVFSVRLKEQIDEILAKQEVKIVKNLKKSQEVLDQKIDKIFEKMEAEISKILKFTRLRLKSILSNDWKFTEFASLKDDFEAIIEEYLEETIDSNQYIHAYIEKYNEFTHLMTHIQNQAFIHKIDPEKFTQALIEQTASLKKSFANFANDFVKMDIYETNSSKSLNKKKTAVNKTYNSLRKFHRMKTCHQDKIRRVTLFEEENKMASCSDDKTIMIWDLNNFKLLKKLKGHKLYVLNVLKLKDGTLASASSDTMIKIWNIHSGICLKTLRGHDDLVEPMVELTNSILVSGSLDQSIKFWNLKKNSEEACIKTLSGYFQTDCYSICVLTQDEIACSSGSSVNIYEINGGEKPIKTLKDSSSDREIFSLLSSKDGETLIAGFIDGAVWMWKWRAGMVLKFPDKHKDSINKILWFDSSVFYTASDDNTIKFWSLQGVCLKTDNHSESCNDVTASETVGIVVCSGKNIIFYGH